MATAQQVANFLKSNNIPVTSVTEADDEVDGCVQITAEVSVQVGDCYMMVVREEAMGTADHAFNFGPERRTPLMIVSRDIPAALAAAKVQA